MQISNMRKGAAETIRDVSKFRKWCVSTFADVAYLKSAAGLDGGTFVLVVEHIISQLVMNVKKVIHCLGG